MRQIISLTELKSTSAGKRRDNQHLFQDKVKQKRQKRKVSPNVIWLQGELEKWCKERGYTLKTEFLFHPYRKWRFDWGIFKGVTVAQIERFEYEKENIICSIEYNGIRSKKSRHTTHEGYTGDLDKINAALSLGWRVYQFTPLNYTNIISELEKITI